jgi:hypothetical protein
MSSVFSTLQTYLGSTYVNDFNFLGRTYQVTGQAEPHFRIRPSDIQRLYARNNQGGMVPLGTVLNIHEVAGPDKVMHYDLFPSGARSRSVIVWPAARSWFTIRTSLGVSQGKEDQKEKATQW